jgi:predicted metalloprotease with PDZ domain
MDPTNLFARRVSGLALLSLSLMGLPWLASAAGAGTTCEALDKCPCVFEMVESTLGRGWVGISMSHDGTRYVISEVVPGGPAAHAGLKIGDRMLAMNGVPMSREHEEELSVIYRAMVPGYRLTYTVNRQGTQQDIRVVLGHLPNKILALLLGQQLLESYEQTTGKPLHPHQPPKPAPGAAPEAPKGSQRKSDPTP